MDNIVYFQQTIPAKLDRHRLDQALAVLCPKYSRSQIQHWIKDGYVQINHQIESKPKTTVYFGQEISISAHIIPKATWIGENIPLKIIYQDEDLIIIDKPAGLVVHPGAGNPSHTLVNALLHYDPTLAAVPRAGLVHRLDKDTSGLLVVARHLSAHHYLVKILQLREMKREYEAIVQGVLKAGGVIKTLIGRHPRQRTKMSVVNQNGKPAVTHYRIMHNFKAHTHVRIQLETGRTHQIRVHFAHIKHPLLGDPEYGSRKKGYIDFSRQALHAVQLTLSHPRTGEILTWTSPLPEDFQQLLQTLRKEFI